MNKINADYLPKLLSWYKQNGWNFITFKEAMTDPIYAEADDFVGNKGVSQIERLIKDDVK